MSELVHQGPAGSLPYRRAEWERFIAAHPALEGMAPTCDWCRFVGRGELIGDPDRTCTLVPPVTRRRNADCDQQMPDGAAAFVYDERDVAEQYPNAGPETIAFYSAKGEDLRRVTRMLVRKHVEQGGEVSDFPVLRLRNAAGEVVPFVVPRNLRPALPEMDESNPYQTREEDTAA